jgi:folate-binding protein YgfZ
VAAFADPRNLSMGVRILCSEQSLELDDTNIEKINNPSEYNMIRTTLGIPESSKELGGQLPLNMHMHYLNAVSFDKGCYIGQELT